MNKSHWLSRSLANWLFAVILLCALALRVYHLEFHSLWSDELTTWYEVWRPSFADFWTRFVSLELTPPLFFSGEFLVSRFFAASEWSLRLLSVLAGVGFVAATGLFARELTGRKNDPWATVIGAAFAAFSYRAILFSQEARSYSLLFFLTALSGWAWLRVLNQTDCRFRKAWPYIAICILLSYTHYFGVLMIISQALSLTLVLPRRGQRLQFALYWSTVYAVILVAFSPWLWFLHAHPMPNTALHKAVPWTEIFIAQRELFGSSSVNSLLALLLAFSALVLSRQKRRNLAVFTWIFTPFFMALVVTAFFKPIYGVRNYMVVLGPMLAIAAAGCADWRSKSRALAIVLGLAFVVMGLVETVFARHHYTRARSDQVREAIEASVPLLRENPKSSYLLVGLVPYQPGIYLERFHSPKEFDAIYNWPDFLKTDNWPASVRAADEIVLLYFADDIRFCDDALRSLSDRYQVVSRTELTHESTVLLRKIR